MVKKRDLDLCECRKFILEVQDSLDVLHGRWKLPILITLKFGSKRFTEISDEVNGITDRVLSRELKELEAQHMIVRTVHETFPPKVVYSITEHGQSLDSVILALRDWGNHHRKKVIGK